MMKNTTTYMAITTLFLLLYGCLSKQERKPSILAGYLSGSVVFFTLEIHVDSTYTYDLGLGDKKRGRWTIQNDTFRLYDELSPDSISAIIVNQKARGLHQEYFPLENLKMKSFDPPKVVIFPED